jgi:hypothetical protein
MKKLLTKLLTLLLALVALSNISLAAPAEVTQIKSTDYDDIQQYIDELRDIHKHAIEAGLCTLNGNSLAVNIDIHVLDISEESAQNYASFISNLNDIAELGVITINNDFSISTLPSEEATKIIYERDQAQMNTSSQSSNAFDIQKVVESPSQLKQTRPTLNAYSIAKSNWSQLMNYYTAVAVTSPTSAWTSTVAWWVAKVKPGGAWDYKSLSGYSPYNKTWNAVQKNTTSTKTSEWFGNYNYGFTGKALFSLNTLLSASKMVSYGYSHAPDSDEDIAAVTQGYNEAP